MSTNLFRAAGAVVALSVCAWGIYLRPRPLPPTVFDPSEGLTADEAGLLQERTTVLIRAHRYQDALPLARRTLDAFPGNPVYLRQMADIQEQLGHYAEAAAAWESYLKVSPTPSEAFPALPDAYRKLGRMAASIDACQRALALEPRNPDFLFNLGRAYEWGHQYDKARQTYQRCCTLSPGSPDALAGWARMEVFIGDPAQALRLTGKVLARNPDTVDALLVQGMAQRQLGQYDAARAALEHGLRLSPQYADFMLVLAGIAVSQDRPGEARTWYDRYLALRPDDAQARARRAAIPGQER